jgi:hypothetical protein
MMMNLQVRQTYYYLDKIHRFKSLMNRYKKNLKLKDLLTFNQVKLLTM